MKVKYLPGELQKVNFGSFQLRSGYFSLLKTVGEDQPSIPAALGLVNLAHISILQQISF